MIMKNGNKLRIIGFVITLIGIILFILGPIFMIININNSPDEFPFMIILSFIGFPFIFVGSILAKIGSNQVHNFGINNFDGNVNQIVNNDKKSCPKCGFSNDHDAEFCSNCGSLLENYCPNCNTSNDIDANYCKKCGQKLKN